MAICIIQRLVNGLEETQKCRSRVRTCFLVKPVHWLTTVNSENNLRFAWQAMLKVPAEEAQTLAIMFMKTALQRVLIASLPNSLNHSDFI